MGNMLIHSFLVDIAKQFGLEKAILLSNFHFWISKNKANKQNEYEGKYWTYNSYPALAELFPYLSMSSIKRHIGQLQDMGILLIGHHNKDWSNRTNWYTIDYAKLDYASAQFDTMSSDHSDTMSSGQNDTMYIDSNIHSTNTVKDKPSAPKNKASNVQNTSGMAQKELIKTFTDAWALKFGTKYHFLPKDGVNASKILKTVDLQDLLPLIPKYFQSQDKFVIDNKYSFGVFISQLNNLSAGQAQKWTY